MKGEDEPPDSTDSLDTRKSKKSKTKRRVSDDTYDDQEICDDMENTPKRRKLSASSLPARTKKNAQEALAAVTGKPNVLRCAITELNNIANTIEMSHIIRGGLPTNLVSKPLLTTPKYGINA